MSFILVLARKNPRLEYKNGQRRNASQSQQNR